MSAIAGIFHVDGRPVERADLYRMLASMPHRGPDGSASWTDGVAGLGHLMLRTTPESVNEDLPLTSRVGALTVTADARIDNRDELMSALGIVRQARPDFGDGALILAAYEKWGEECAGKLIGDFAFAIWDGRRRQLYCARDPIGVKPFYYCSISGMFAFATEIKGLLGLRQVPRRLNELRVADHLVPNLEDKVITFYRDIFRLAPGQYLVAGTESMRIRQYWTPDAVGEVRLGSDQDYAEAFRAIFTEAVRCRVRGTQSVGSTLSGGLDSSSISCTARGVLAEEGGGRRLSTFSAIFPGLCGADLRRIDERTYVEAVVASGGFHPHYVRADCLSPLGGLSTVLRQFDEAFVAPNLYVHRALYGAARQQGTRILLDGLDGDTAVSHGLGYLAELAGAWQWRTLVREATALSTRASASFTPRRIIWDYAIGPNLSGLTKFCQAVRTRFQPAVPADSLVASDFARRVGLADRLEALPENGPPPRTAREAHARGITSGLVPYVLEMADKAAAGFGLEPRYPFFDRRLLEFCVALPPEQKLNDGWTRVIMRRGMDGILPPAVQWRYDKANLSPNFTRRLAECEQETMDRTVLGDAQAIGEYVDLPSLRRAHQRYAEPSSRNAQDAHTIYRAVVLNRWLHETSLQS